MSGESREELKLRRALTVVENHIDDAEQVTWEAATHTDREAVKTELEAVTQRIWDLQQDISELKGDIDG